MFILLVVTALLLVPARSARGDDPLPALIQHDLQFSAQQLSTTTGMLSATEYPNFTTTQGAWETTSASNWTSGFFPGSLWLLYQQSGDAAWMTRAQTWQTGLESQQYNTSTHDVGFIIFTSFGNGYRLTGNEAYRQVILTAAGSLATRYSPVVGCIKSWNGGPPEFKVIIDNMMNLELLFWAAKHGGKHEWYDMAVSHALKTRENHVRADGSTYHLVNYDPNTGAVQSKGTVQGYSAESTWSRGQAWAIYGFTMTYRETGDPRFLDTARATADYFINHLPGDDVPYWDFQAPNIPNEPKDSSAAAIAASGLIELSQLERDSTRQQTYRAAARAILLSLSSSAYLAEGTANHAILLHGTRNKPNGSYDTGLIWGDYYFLEALLRYTDIISSTGVLTGRITDRTTGAGLAQASVTYTRDATTTDPLGYYRLAQILPGTYAVTASASGYLSATQEVTVTLGASVSTDFALIPIASSSGKQFTVTLPLILTMPGSLQHSHN